MSGRKYILSGFMAGLIAGGAMATAVLAADEDTSQEALEERNRQIAVEFYDRLLNQLDFESARELMGDEYIQHNPNAVDGFEGVRQHIEMLKENYPQNHGEIKRVLADGDLVALHVHSKRTPESRGNAIVDIFRLEDGKVVEHWDVVQPVPEESLNDNTMF